MYARFPPFFGQPGPSCGVRRSGFFACPAPDTAVPVRTRRRVEPAPAVMAMVVAGRWQIREARQHVCSVGAGRGTPAAVRVVGESGRGVSRSAENPGRVSVCPAAGEGSRMPIRVSAGPKAGERMNAGTPSACLPACLPGNAGACHPNRDVGLPERDACCGCGRSAVLAARKK